jgi:hypothetical protein
LKHGCADLTSSIDADRRNSSIVALGSFGVLRRVTLDDGTSAALNTVRLHTILGGDDKGFKVTSIPLFGSLFL